MPSLMDTCSGIDTLVKRYLKRKHPMYQAEMKEFLFCYQNICYHGYVSGQVPTLDIQYDGAGVTVNDRLVGCDGGLGKLMFAKGLMQWRTKKYGFIHTYECRNPVTNRFVHGYPYITEKFLNKHKKALWDVREYLLKKRYPKDRRTLTYDVWLVAMEKSVKFNTYYFDGSRW